MNKKITAYYITLVLVLAIQVVTTILQGSVVVSHGKKVARAETQIRELQQQKNVLIGEIAKESSLLAITATTSLDEYQPISSPLVITTNTTVAYSGL